MAAGTRYIVAFNDLLAGVSDRATTTRGHCEEGAPCSSSLVVACYGFHQDETKEVAEFLGADLPSTIDDTGRG